MAGDYIYLEVDAALDDARRAAKMGLDAIGLAWVDPEGGLPDPVPPAIEAAAQAFATVQRLCEEARAGIAAEVAAEQAAHDADAGRWEDLGAGSS